MRKRGRETKKERRAGWCRRNLERLEGKRGREMKKERRAGWCRRNLERLVALVLGHGAEHHVDQWRRGERGDLDGERGEERGERREG
jgi:hypothetical protein